MLRLSVLSTVGRKSPVCRIPEKKLEKTQEKGLGCKIKCVNLQAITTKPPYQRGEKSIAMK